MWVLQASESEIGYPLYQTSILDTSDETLFSANATLLELLFFKAIFTILIFNKDNKTRKLVSIYLQDKN